MRRGRTHACTDGPGVVPRTLVMDSRGVTAHVDCDVWPEVSTTWRARSHGDRTIARQMTVGGPLAMTRGRRPFPERTNGTADPYGIPLRFGCSGLGNGLTGRSVLTCESDRRREWLHRDTGLGT